MTFSLVDAALVLGALHTVGAALGAGGVTFAELHYFKGVADGTLDASEKKHIRATFFALHWGMSLVLLSSIGLIVLEYFLPDAPQHVLTAPFWMANTLILVILLCGSLLSRRMISMSFGGSVALTAWWTILILDAWRGDSPDYLTLLLSFVVTAACVMFALSFARGMIHAHKS